MANAPRARRVSAVPREIVMGLDLNERRAGWFATGYSTICFLLQIYLYATPRFRVQESGFSFALIPLFTIVLGISVWRHKRAGTIFGAVFVGLIAGLGVLGLPLILFGGWLLIRAHRLQKYGEANFVGSSRVARERAVAKREGKSLPNQGSEISGAPAARRPAAPSKRYTPKKTARKKS